MMKTGTIIQYVGDMDNPPNQGVITGTRGTDYRVMFDGKPRPKFIPSCMIQYCTDENYGNEMIRFWDSVSLNKVRMKHFRNFCITDNS